MVDENNIKVHFLNKYKPSISAGVASFAQCTLFYWCDLGKNRMQAGKTTTIKELIRYNGYKLALVYIVFARSLGFGIFEANKKLLSKKYLKMSENTKDLLSSIILSIIKPVFLFPIETMKIQIQVNNKSFIEAYYSMIYLENSLKFYSLIYLLIKNFFAYYSWFRTRDLSSKFIKNSNINLSILIHNFIVGSISSFVSFLCTSPFSTLKTLRQIGSKIKVKQLINSEGVLRLHKGYIFHFSNIVLGGGVFNLVYTHLMNSKMF